jgi:hypothetical protein
MQIDFEPKKIKEAKAYVEKLKPIKLPTVKERLNGEFYVTNKSPSFIKRVLNFLFK